MPECELTPGCIFFNNKMKDMPGTSNILKDTYCRRDFQDCAGFQVAQALGRPKVPPDLYPQQSDKAKALIA